MKILGIETSCDETAVAVLKIKHGSFKVLANVIASSVKLQAKYGGIVPEVAARKQMEYIVPVIEAALKNIKSVDYIAVTTGPGLITSLRVGVEVAKTLSYVWRKPLITVNHLEGHIYSALLNNFQFSRRRQGFGEQAIFSEGIPKDSSESLRDNFQTLKKINFPTLALIVSGGHTQLVLMKDYLKYKIIGETLDDAVGEAFDKVAKILRLGYPGGPIVSKLAEGGDANRIRFPRPMINSGDYNFSFSGIKTAVLYLTRDLKKKTTVKQWNNETMYNICASFQQACIDVLVVKTIKAAKKYKVKTIILGGGVAANKKLRSDLAQSVKEKLDKVALLIPEINLTGDNALMIALAGYYKIKEKKFSDFSQMNVEANLRL